MYIVAEAMDYTLSRKFLVAQNTCAPLYYTRCAR